MPFARTIKRVGDTATNVVDSVSVVLDKNCPTRVRVVAAPGSDLAQVALVTSEEEPYRELVTLQEQALFCPNNATALEWLLAPCPRALQARIFFCRAAGAVNDVDLKILVEREAP